MNRNRSTGGRASAALRFAAALCTLAACGIATALAQDCRQTGIATPGNAVFQSLANWTAGRVNPTTPGASPVASPALAATPAAFWLVHPPLAQGLPRPLAQAPSYAAIPVVLAQPDVPFRLADGGSDPGRPWDVNANYHGMAVSAVMLDSQNLVTDTRSLAAPFRAGERFKLRIVSTSDVLISLDALRAPRGTVGPNGVLLHQPSWIGQLYPARQEQVVQAKAGEVVYLPLGTSEYFTFDGRPGVDMVSLNLRHPQASNALLNRQPVYRHDAQGMTSFAQLVQPGSHMGLTQLLALQHVQ
ncbi:hypothetical protein SAMN05216204_10227 [Massilia yuzhufengensis]|uniref:DUF4384 domain-containing protein n=2 Tax=Massilia yuzhufengensis TaxID=1164594 RepID=A0A1I1E995_9BURK|nr:hypothetical protein SAMN05216204_10227 [Massilia yuzhufengensis]